MRSKRRYFIFILILITFLSSNWILKICYAKNQGNDSNVILIINSISKDSIDRNLEDIKAPNPSPQLHFQGDRTQIVLRDLQRERINFDQINQNINLDNIDIQDAAKAFKTEYLKNHNGIKPDIILVNNDKVSNLVDIVYDELFEGTYVICCDQNYLNNNDIKHKGNFLYIENKDYVKKTVEAICKIHPKTNQIAVYKGSLEDDTYLNEEFEKTIRLYPEIKFVLKDLNNISNIEEDIKKLPSNTAIIPIGSIKKDMINDTNSFGSLCSYISSITNLPMYSFNYNDLGNGIVGGYIIEDSKISEAVAQIIINIFKGVSFNGNNDSINYEAQYIFDGKKLRDLKISADQIPLGSIIFNRDRTYKINFLIFWGIIGTLIVLIGLSSVLIINIHKRKKVEKRIEFMAYHDSLTGINNRQSLLREMERLCASKKNNIVQVAVLFIDLDNFKTINDTVGHDFGDKILIDVAEYIRKIIPPDQFCARLGGDEFVILLKGKENASKVNKVANDILNEIKTPIKAGKREFFIGASIGVALSPEHAKDGSELLKKADLAMYSAKNKGKNRFVVYDNSLEEVVQDRAKLEEDLHNALQNEEFELYYQPKLNISGSIIIGAEALIRWNHPRRGIVSPIEFIPFAEETGLIINIGEWVLKTACSNIIEY